MIIDTKLARAFNKAVTNLDNIHMGTQEGEINWNFVDADCYMAMTAGNPLFDTREEGQAYVDQFNYLADCFLGEITLADRLQDEYPVDFFCDKFDGVLPVTNKDLILDPSKPAYLVRVK